MAKKILVITTSLRNDSNSDRLADAFIRGAEEAGCDVRRIGLKDKTIAFCTGCFACHALHRCAIQDDAVAIAEEMRVSDVIVWATPIYFYEMSGQMKTLMDRCNPLYSNDCAFRDIYFLSTAGEKGKDLDARAIQGLSGWIECFPGVRLAGKVLADGIYDAGGIVGHPALKEAYEMGKSLCP